MPANLIGVSKEAAAAADTPFRADIAQRVAVASRRDCK